MNSFANMQRKLYSLLILEHNDQVLLGYKKRGFGQGMWNGFGGKIEQGETPEGAAIREMKEESGLDISLKDLEKMGLLEFSFDENAAFVMQVHVFAAYKFSGLVTESEEMSPKWFAKDALPYDRMWADDAVWYPFLFRKLTFRGHAHFRGERIVRHDIRTGKPILGQRPSSSFFQ